MEPKPGNFRSADAAEPFDPDEASRIARYAASPRAIKDDDLRAWVETIRDAAGSGILAIIAVEPHRRWRLARLYDADPPHFEYLDESIYDNLEEAESALFRHCYVPVRSIDPGPHDRWRRRCQP